MHEKEIEKLQAEEEKVERQLVQEQHKKYIIGCNNYKHCRQG